MNVLDYVLLAVLGLSALSAMQKGFAYEVLMMAATLLGLGLAAWKFPAVAPWFSWLGSEEARNFAAFVVIVGATLIVAMVVGRLVRGALHAVGLKWFDRFLGALLGLVRGLVLGAAMVMLLTAFPFNPRLVRGSQFAPRFLWGSRALALVMPRAIASRFDTHVRELD